MLGILLFCFLDIYFTARQTSFTKFFSRFIPYPALLMNHKIVTVGQYDTLKKDYKDYLGNQNFEKDLFLKVLIRNMALEQIIIDLGLKIEPRELNDFLNNFYQNNRVFIDDRGKFNDYFVKPLFYRKKIIKKITEDKSNLENKKKIELIYADLVQNSDLFISYSELYQDQKLGIDGNLIGWLAYGDLPESLQERLGKMEVGDFTPIIKSISGYHIYKLNGKINKGENNYYYQFDQIFLPLQNFEDYLDNFLKDSKILYFLKK